MMDRVLARGTGVALALSLLGVASVSHADTLTLQNDGFVDGDSIGLQEGFSAGEAAAVTLGPLDGPYSVEKVQLIFGPALGSQIVTLRIYVESGGANPGTMLYEADYELQSADDAMIELDLSAENVAVASGSIRVALLFQHSGAPSVARDDDGSIQAGRNWIFDSDGNWGDSQAYNLEGDWIIRAEVETEANPAVSSSGASTSASSGDATGSGASTGLTTGVGPGSTGAGATGSTGAGAPVCTPGETQACFGDGACQGGQSCLADGTGWDACTCGSGDGGNSGGEAEDGGEDSGCGCSMPGASPAGGAAIVTLGALALGLSRRRSRRRP